MLEGPQRLFFAGLRVLLNNWKLYNRPDVRFKALKVAAQVVIVQPLHDYNNRGFAAVGTVADGGLEFLVYLLADLLAAGIVRLDGVVYYNSAPEAVRVQACEFVQGCYFVGQFFIVLFVYDTGSEACNLSGAGNCVHTAPGPGLPFAGAYAGGLRLREHGPVFLRAHNLLNPPGIIAGQVVAIRQMNETGGRVYRKAFRYKVLNS